MDYCGLKSINVRASSRGGRSRKGNPQKAKKAHSRRKCYKTSDASQNSAECTLGQSKRCVLLHRVATKSRSKRTEKTYQYSFDVKVSSVSPKATHDEILNWYKYQIEQVADILGYKSAKVIPTDKTGYHYRIVLESTKKISDNDLEIESDILADPDSDGNYPIKDEIVAGERVSDIYKGN